MHIQRVRAWEILDSRGWPTLEAEVLLEDGTLGRACVPSGASTGEHEALELRDGERRYLGKGVGKAAAVVGRELDALLRGRDPREQRALDGAMISLDGTPGKGRLGANAILSVSLAASRAAAAALKLPLYRYLRKAFGLDEREWLLPAPMLNVINGGRHADSGLDIQEFMVVPLGLPSFREALRAGAEIYQALRKRLAAMGMSVAVGDEGGFAPRLKNHAEALEVLSRAVGDCGAQGRVRLALDAAASEFYGDGSYLFEGKPRAASQMGEIYSAWAKAYGLVSIEDPLAEDDWEGWKSLTSSLGGSLRLVGDDLFVTSPQRLERGIREGAANAILIKLNQIGTLSETVETVLKARKAGYAAIISHRSGETEDPYIADLAVALNAGALKSGAPCRSERLAKYNQLLRIESELGPQARYAQGLSFLSEVKAS